MKYLSIIANILAIVSIAVSISFYSHLRQLECDIVDGFSAERSFTRPMFQELGKNPDDYGKGISNPILGSKRYFHCAN